MPLNPLKTKAVSIVTAEKAVNDHAGIPQAERANGIGREGYSMGLLVAGGWFVVSSDDRRGSPPDPR